MLPSDLTDAGRCRARAAACISEETISSTNLYSVGYKASLLTYSRRRFSMLCHEEGASRCSSMLPSVRRPPPCELHPVSCRSLHGSQRHCDMQASETSSADNMHGLLSPSQRRLAIVYPAGFSPNSLDSCFSTDFPRRASSAECGDPGQIMKIASPTRLLIGLRSLVSSTASHAVAIARPGGADRGLQACR